MYHEILVSDSLFSLLAVFNISPGRNPADDVSLLVPHRPVMNAKPAIPTVLPAHSIFQLKRIPARKPRLALGPHPLHIIRMTRTKISIPDLCRAKTHVFERSFIPRKHTAVRRDDDDGLRYGVS